MDQRVTVLGAGGWIGTALVEALKHQGRRVQAVKRDGLAGWLDSNEPPGTVIDTIGLTADFRQRPHATVEAHVEILSRIVKRPGLFNLLFLSSTRVYSRSSETREDTPLPCLSSDPSDGCAHQWRPNAVDSGRGHCSCACCGRAFSARCF